MSNLTGAVSLALEAAKARGADSADAILIEQKSVEVSILNGATEHVERSEGYDLGLRVFCGRSQAIVSTNKLDQDTIQKAAGRAVDMARAALPIPSPGSPPRSSWRRACPISIFGTTAKSVGTRFTRSRRKRKGPAYRSKA